MFEKRMTSAVLTLIMLFALIFPGQTLASTTPTVNRLAGQDRYETAAAIARQWSHSDYAILVSGENYPDALASAPLAQKHKAPILLTASDSLPASTKQALADLEVNQVIIIGGTGVIAPSIEAELQAMGISTTRLAGQNRYETALKIAGQVQNSPTQLFVCTGDDFADALSVAPIAAIEQIPIILVSGDSLANSVQEYLDLNSAHITKTFVIGYSDVISDQVAGQFPHVERIVGADKYARNIAVNEQFNHLFSTEALCIASGEGFADALAGSALAAQKSQPILLVNNATPDTTKKYYQQRSTSLDHIIVFGGTGIVADKVMQDLKPSADFADLPVGIRLDKSNIALTIGQSESLTAILDRPAGSVEESSNELVWLSSNPTVATVNQGKVVGINNGSASITVKTKDGNQASCLVTVNSLAGKHRTMNISNYTKAGADTATFRYQLLDEAGKDITAAIPTSQLSAVASLGSSISLDPSKGIGTVTFNSAADTDKPIIITLVDLTSGAVVRLDSAAGIDSSSFTYPIGIPKPELPLTNPIQYTNKIVEITITSTILSIDRREDGDVGYAVYVVKDQNGYDITHLPLANNLKVTSDIGTASTATDRVLKVKFPPNVDPSSLTGITVTITDPQSGVTTTATLEPSP
ncbi:Ig domain protein group 2 domain protein [Desulfitobacterium hafniense DCB-2]|uniref:Ig domain protein group 2 domain protein n=1 Tax=Desulfitobacterium hafniense (strain DSM 10664 / DCB-2) TaxID=272564 RepID=B8FYX1_DESHD|nr:cell wall-binding repeat-containing protein [Desulfitobacterium hafniense]ACL22723.1 Ig domain protein group 2 domain protein [Desulfitobacterium hafniense DCB-2]